MRSVSKSAVLLPAFLAGMGLVNAALAEEPFFSAGVKVGVQRTDNRDLIVDGAVVNGVPRKKEDQTTWSVAPWAAIHREIVDLLFLDAKYAPSFNRRDNCRVGQEESKWTHSATLSMLYAFGPKTTLNVSDTFHWLGDRSVYYGSDEEYDAKRDSRVNDDYTDNRLRVSLTRKLSETGDYVKASGRWSVKRYDEGEIAKYSDTDEWGARFDAMHVCSSSFALGAYVDWSTWDRENHLGFDMGVDTLEGGVQGEWDFSGDGNHRIYASVGYENVRHEADELDDQSAAGGRVELRLFQQTDTHVLAGARYGVDFSDVYPFSSQEDLRGYVSVKHFFDVDRRLSAQASVELRTRTYNLKDDMDPEAARYGYAKALIAANGGRTSYDRDMFYFRLSGDYRITQRVSVGAFYSYEDIDCDVTSSYKDNVFGVNCTARLF